MSKSNVQRTFVIEKSNGRSSLFFHRDGWVGNKQKAQKFATITQAGTCLNALSAGKSSLKLRRAS